MSRMSRAWVQAGPHELTMVELPVPEKVAPDGALARVEANGICGSDYEQYVGHLDGSGVVNYPLVIGHEPVVRIEDIGDEARRKWGVEAGDRVAVEPHAGCGVCGYCTSGRMPLCRAKIMYGYVPLSVGSGLWGGLAEVMELGGNTILHRLPEELSSEDALMFNPLSAGFEWAVNKGGVGIGDDVLILGAGQRGLSAVIASREAGARRIAITGLAADRPKLELAASLGATDIIVTDPADPDSLRSQMGTEFADVVVDMVPYATSTIGEAIRSARIGGRIVIGGIKGGREIPGFVSDDLLFKSLTVVGALGVASKGYRQAIDALLSGRYDFSAWHTHTLPLDRADEAVKVLGGEIKTGVAPLHVSVIAA
jgi:threonine dehydrogenase-like Zn-dependent dehydrogenase